MKCPTQWAWTLGNLAKCVTIVWPNQTTFATMITHVFYRNPVECIEFLMQQPAFREHMSYAPAKKYNYAVKSSDWCWNYQVRELNFVIATIILIASLATAAAWYYNCPVIRQFRPDTSYTLLGRQEEMASIFESQKHRLDD
jgi:hypothetical protein